MALNVKAKAKTMEDKKQSGELLGKKIVHFIGDIKAEFKKISWTSKEELRTYTKIVVGSTFIFGILVYVADLFIQRCLFGLDSIFRLITG